MHKLIHELLEFVESYWFVAIMCVVTLLVNVLEAKRRSKLPEEERQAEDRR